MILGGLMSGEWMCLNLDGFFEMVNKRTIMFHERFMCVFEKIAHLLKLCNLHKH